MMAGYMLVNEQIPFSPCTLLESDILTHEIHKMRDDARIEAIRKKITKGAVIVLVETDGDSWYAFRKWSIK